MEVPLIMILGNIGVHPGDSPPRDGVLMNRSGDGGDADLVDVEAGSTVRNGTKNQSTAMKRSSRMMVIGSGIMSDGDLVRSGERSWKQDNAQR